MSIEMVGYYHVTGLYYWDGKANHPVVREAEIQFLFPDVPNTLANMNTEELNIVLKYEVQKFLFEEMETPSDEVAASSVPKPEVRNEN